MARCPDCDLSCPEGATDCQRCGATLSMVCAQCDAGNPALARFCCGCGSRLDKTLDEDAGPSSLARPEWRQLTLLFCDVVGSTALGRKLDPEDWHLVIQRVHSTCGDVVAKHHGHVAQYLGDGLLAYFGYPVAAEDAPRRAVAAALELVREIAEIKAPEAVQVRVGIHTGPVIVGNVGSRRHQESLALGQTPALAARLQEVAPPGCVVISPETMHLVDGFFDCEELGTFPLKGFAHSQLAYRVVAERGLHTRMEVACVSGLTPLVGRAAEVSLLKSAWAKASAGTSATILLTGEPGIGKSRLLHELRRTVTGAHVLELRCFQHVRTSILHPVIDCLQRLVGNGHGDDREATRLQIIPALQAAELNPPQTALLLSLFGLAIDPALLPASQLREAMLEAVGAWLLGPAAMRPRLIIVEDVQWADPATVDLLTGIFANLPPGVLFVLTARPEFAAPWGERCSMMTLGRLGAADTRQLVTWVAGNKPLPDEVVQRLAARAECIPLFLEEMTKAVLDSGLIRETTDSYVLDQPIRDSAIPATLYDSLTGRLDQLGNGRPVAQLAAVLGREFRLGLFEAAWRRIPATPELSLKDALERLVRAQLLVIDGSQADPLYQFKHALIQEAAYQSLLRSTRQNFHRFAAEAIVENFPARAEREPELVAYHYSGAQERQHAVEYWSKAGQRAIGGSAYVEAISHFGGGLQQLALVAASPETFRLEIGLRCGLGLALIASRGFASKDVEETYVRAAELCHDIGDEIPTKVLYGTWAVNLVRSDLASTTRMLPSLERLASTAQDPGARLVGHAAIATWAFWRGDYAKAMRHSVQGIELVDARAPKEQHGALLRDHGFEGVFFPGVYLAWSQVLTGDVQGARDSWQRVKALGESIGDPYVSAAVFAFGSTLHHDLGDLATAEELATKLCSLCQDKPFPFWHGVGLIVSGSCLTEDADIDQAIERIQQGIKMYRGTGASAPCSYHLKFLAEAYLAKREPSRAIEVLQEALAMMRTSLDCNFEPELLRLLAQALEACGELDAAKHTLASALDICRAHGARLLELKVATTLAQVLGRCGDKLEARRVFESVADTFNPADFVQLRESKQSMLDA